MKISIDWLNTYLDKAVDAETVERVLTNQGMPIESIDQLEGETLDLMLDVEVTSNRSDCLSHLGLAREVAAGTGGKFTPPAIEIDTVSSDVEADPEIHVRVDNPQLCPLYTARVIRGVKIGQSPSWLIKRIESIGLRSVNNVVDITNYVLMEYGQPLHAFDLGTIAGQTIVIRNATKNEPFEAIDGSKHHLQEQMLVIADGDRAVALAGVMGGINTEVTDQTTDVLLESALFDPVSVRGTSRTLKLASESSYRFERGVDPKQVDAASRRATQLICELAGGTYDSHVITVGKAPEAHPPITMRAKRCNQLLGVDIPTKDMVEYLAKLDFQPELGSDQNAIICRPPSYRHDIEREIDLIEEVARLHGFDPIPVDNKIHIATQPIQHDVSARQAIRRVLTAHGFHETINPSLIEEGLGRYFLTDDTRKVMLDGQYRRPDSMLRPSLLPSLLSCRKLNQDVGNHNLRLFEMASVWTSENDQVDGGQSLAMMIDAQDSQQALRTLRSAVEDLAKQLKGVASLEISPGDRAGFSQSITIRLGQNDVGYMGVIGSEPAKAVDLQTPVAAVELDLQLLINGYPPSRNIKQLCRFPSIQRDLSLIIQEDVTWQSISGLIRESDPDFLEQTKFIGTYRGKPIPKNKKSVSLRLEFRNPQGTLRHEEVDPQINSLIDVFTKHLDAQLRS